MKRAAAALLPLLFLVATTGCGKKINHITFDKVAEIVTPSMNTKTALDWDKVEELLGGPGRDIDVEAYKKLLKKTKINKEPYKDAKIKIWRGKRGTFIAIEYDPKTQAAKGYNASVPSK